MKKWFLATVAFLLSATLSFSVFADPVTLPVPTGQNYYAYEPIGFPVLSDGPSTTKPIGVGFGILNPLIITLFVNLDFENPMNIYFGFITPEYPEWGILTSEGKLDLRDNLRLLPWKTGVTHVDEIIPREGFAYTQSLRPGNYIFVLVATVDNFQNYYAWETGLTVPESPPPPKPRLEGGIIFPHDGMLEGGLMSIQGHWDYLCDGFGPCATPVLSRAVLYIDDGLALDERHIDPEVKMEFDAGTLTSGIHTLTMVVTDSKGNQAEDSVTINIDPSQMKKASDDYITKNNLGYNIVGNNGLPGVKMWQPGQTVYVEVTEDDAMQTVLEATSALTRRYGIQFVVTKSSDYYSIREPSKPGIIHISPDVFSEIAGYSKTAIALDFDFFNGYLISGANIICSGKLSPRIAEHEILHALGIADVDDDTIMDSDSPNDYFGPVMDVSLERMYLTGEIYPGWRSPSDVANSSNARTETSNSVKSKSSSRIYLLD